MTTPDKFIQDINRSDETQYYYKKGKSSYCQNCGGPVYAVKKGNDGALVCLECLGKLKG